MCSYPDTNIYPRLFFTLYFHFFDIFVILYCCCCFFLNRNFKKSYLNMIRMEMENCQDRKCQNTLRILWWVFSEQTTV